MPMHYRSREKIQRSELRDCRRRIANPYARWYIARAACYIQAATVCPETSARNPERTTAQTCPRWRQDWAENLLVLWSKSISAMGGRKNDLLNAFTILLRNPSVAHSPVNAYLVPSVQRCRSLTLSTSKHMRKKGRWPLDRAEIVTSGGYLVILAMRKGTCSLAPRLTGLLPSG